MTICSPTDQVFGASKPTAYVTLLASKADFICTVMKQPSNPFFGGDYARKTSRQRY